MNIFKKQLLLKEFDELQKRYAKCKDDGERRNLKHSADQLCSEFLEAGVSDVGFLLEIMHSDAIFRHRHEFLKRGVNIDFSRLIYGLSDDAIKENYREIIEMVDPDTLAEYADYSAIERVFTLLANDDADLEKIFAKLAGEGEESFLYFNRSVFLAHGYSFEELSGRYGHCRQAFAIA